MTWAALELQSRLESAWSLHTATIWRADNPAWGQCSVSALVVQDCLGGVIVKTRVGNAWHFYNLVEGERLDFTASPSSTLNVGRTVSIPCWRWAVSIKTLRLARRG
jgi:hypothetical protein